jgi:formylglycine-generating enzyme required for sulfatase activity
MQEKVHIPTSQAFTRTFYHELFDHGQIDLACNAARAKVLTQALLGSHVPVLFTRLHNNQLLVPQPDRSRESKDFEPELVYVRSGTFLMGSPPGEGIPPAETDQHEVHLPPYLIGKYPVTNREYQVYLLKTGRLVNSRAGWNGNIPPEDMLDYPIAGVTWNEAWAYCEWLREETGRPYTLPSEAQWEKAARGTDGRAYPWGDEWEEGRCNHGSDRTSAVDAYPQGVSPYGCYDVVGNVRQWVNTRWGQARDKPDEAYRYPWTPDEREDSDHDNYILRVYRGGAARDDRIRLRCSARGGFRPDRPGPPHRRHGFRIAVNLERQ